MKEEIYEFDNWFEKIKVIIEDFDPRPSKETEKHHIFPRFSNMTLELPKNWHSFITQIQNTISRDERKNALLHLLVSIVAIMLLLVLLMFWLIFRLRRKDNEELCKSLSKKVTGA